VTGSGIGTSSNISGFSDFGRGNKGFGGTATSNRGGKTLVVTSNKNDSKDEAKENRSTFTPFGGSGSVVGSASSSTGNVLHDRQKFLDRLQKTSQNNHPTKKQKTEVNNEQTHCPVCNQTCPASEVNAHLDLCLGNMSMEDEKPSNKTEEIIILSDDEDDETDLEQCPLCSAYYPKDSLQSHIDTCVQHLHDSFIEFGDEDVVIEPKKEITDDDDHVACPVCSTLVAKDSINQHLDNCLM